MVMLGRFSVDLYETFKKEKKTRGTTSRENLPEAGPYSVTTDTKGSRRGLEHLVQEQRVIRQVCCA